ncbi:uncharacterized protein E0L32_002225 [Thyridium curvatum]|uniref:CFEM domain-containing protein n=1 Tax=Thyridium curvatum TaxID=1093900 RepID=A0A507APH4_9PEZI|nr:uncharacterized protein E0L32_002225 [Thyridium curvatum]TPX06729.1 hypothetical protein E0L32_002225 [Thyridium curvatum]
MQPSTLLLAVLAGAGAVSAQSAGDIGDLVSQVPACALSCILQAATAADCGVADYKCQCAHRTQIQTSVDPCLRKGCSDAQVKQVTDITTQICKAVGASTDTASSSGGAKGGSATTGTLETASGAAKTPAQTSSPAQVAGSGAGAPAAAGLAVMGAVALAGAWAL